MASSYRRMFRIHVPSPTVVLFGAVIMYCCASVACGDEHAQKALIEAYRTAESAHQAESLSIKLFQKATTAELLSMQTHENSGIALKAAWTLAHREIVKRNATRDDDWQMQRFLGFLEGRLRVEIPKFLQTAKVYQHSESRTWFLYPGSEPGTLPMRPQPDWPELTHSKDGSIWTLVDGKDRIEVDVPKNRKYHLRNLALIGVSEKRIFLGLPLNVGSPFGIRCFNRKKGNLEWIAGVWADGGFVRHMGLGMHRFDLIEHDGEVLVLGVCDLALYIASYDAETGEARFRFSTRY